MFESLFLESAFVVLVLAGLTIATYFTAVRYHWMRPDPGWIPPVCRLDEGTCEAVVFTPQARVFGVPNSLLGQAYYLALLVGVLRGVALQPPWVFGYLALAATTVALAAYLSYALIYVLRVRCTLCFASHAINFILFLLLASSL